MCEGFSPGGASNNYWGIGCTNTGGGRDCHSYGSLTEGIQGFARTVSSYTKASDGMSNNSMGTKSTQDGFNTNYYPVRLIDDKFLADVLNDFVLKPYFRSPALTIVGNCFYLYIGECSKQGNKFFVKGTNFIPYKFRMSYIDKPRLVKYTIDTGVPNTETELPAYLHNDIVKHAVELWQLSVQGNMATEQNRMRNAQREQVRNNNRSETT